MAGSNSLFEEFIRGLSSVDTLPKNPAKTAAGSVMMAYSVSEDNPYLTIYLSTNGAKVKFLGTQDRIIRNKLNRGNLDEVIKSCEDEMEHRGLRSIQTTKQMDENGRTFAKSYVFDDSSGRFVEELFRLVCHFQDKYR